MLTFHFCLYHAMDNYIYFSHHISDATNSIKFIKSMRGNNLKYVTKFTCFALLFIVISLSLMDIYNMRTVFIL